MIVSVSQAARLSGKSRQSLYDMRDSGKLSFTTDPDNSRVGLDMAELCRVFPRIKLDSSLQQSVASTGHNLTTTQDSLVVSALQAQIDALERLISEKDARISLLEDLRSRSPAVPSQPATTPPITSEPSRRRRGFFDRLADGLTEALK